MPNADINGMAATHAKKLEGLNAAAADRQQRRRERMAARGRPDTSIVDRAIVEALSFTLASTPVTEGKVRWSSLRVSTLVSTAKRILVDREGYDAVETAAAIKLRLAARQPHFDPTFIPSLAPDLDLQSERKAIANDARQSDAGH